MNTGGNAAVVGYNGSRRKYDNYPNNKDQVEDRNSKAI